MSKEVLLILFIVIVAGIALTIPYLIDFFVDFFTSTKRHSKPSAKRRTREEFYTEEFEPDEIYESTEIEPDSEEEINPFSRNVYVCPECGSLKLRMGKTGEISCANCGRTFKIKGSSNLNLH